ncbi:VIT domain-containing protein [Nocardia sp. NPDC051832]|uniref:VIT domain-containing protein n=1 Tax=Nocardia sp. NPDC051832 TaxID=3155673 RepID=UPI0034151C75
MTSIPTIPDQELARIGGPREADELVTGVLRRTDADRTGLPLVAMEVSATVTGLVATTTVRQVFRNTLGTGIEAVYIFPLPDRAAVTSFVADLAGRRVEGVLRERQAARDTYDQAVAEGHRAALAEEDRPGVFTTTVGNLQPGEEATLTLVLTGPLPVDAGAATLRFPLVVPPRYIPGRPLDGPQAGVGTALDTDAVPDASRITPPVLFPGQPSPVELSLTATIDPAGLGPVQVRSSLHAVAEQTHNGTTTVRLHPGERLNRDVVLRLSFGAGSAFASTAVRAEETVQVTLVPPMNLTGSSRSRDVVVVLDRSGSMSGWKMVAARRAACRIVDSLTDRDRFAVLAFDHLIERPSGIDSGLVDALDRHRFAAVRWLSGLESRGGTELAAPLAEAADILREDQGRDRVLVLVTDGQVGDEDRLLQRITPQLNRTRIFTLGIDRAVNAGFLQRLAAIGVGRCALVETEDRLDEVLTDIHRRIAPPVLTDVVVEVDGRPVAEPAPVRSDVFEGVPVVLGGRAAGEFDSVVVRARTAAGADWSTTLPLARSTDKAVRAVWARARIRDLEDAFAARTGVVEAAEIVDFSLKSGVLSRFTAFVAVDSSRTVTGEHHTVVQPVEPADGWEMAGPPPGGPAGAAYASAPLPMAYPAAPRPVAAGFRPPEPGSLPPAPGSAPMPPASGSAPMRPAGAAPKRAPLARSRRTAGVPDVLAAFTERLRAALARPDATTGNELADELESVGAAPELIEALRRLAAALISGNTAVADEAIADIRRIHPELTQKPRRQGFWR